MPHFIIESSENIFEQKSPGEIMRAVYETAEASELFAENDIKVRLRPFRYFLLGEDKKDFIHIFAYVMEGRSAEQKANLGRKIIERLNEMFDDVSFLSISIEEFDRAAYCNKALIHPLNTANDRHFRIENRVIDPKGGESGE